MRILNIAAGKFNPLPLDDKDNMLIPQYILNVDTSYFADDNASVIERDIRYWEKDENKITQYRNFNMDVFEFMERTSLKFDRVVIYRFLEHVTFTQVEYFIYLVSTVLRKGGKVDVIVPNYIQLAEMILNDNPYHSMFAEKNILLTTELLNEPSCPHASIWTPDRMKYFWELENRFRHRVSWPAFKFDGRDIYLRSQMVRL
jgi:hypothetical protein